MTTKAKGSRTRSSSGGTAVELSGEMISSSKKKEEEEEKAAKDKKQKKENHKRSSSVGSTGSSSGGTRKQGQATTTTLGDEKVTEAASAAAKATASNNSSSNNNNDDPLPLSNPPPSSPKQQRQGGRTRSSSGASIMDMSPPADNSSKAIDDKKDQNVVSTLQKSTATAGSRRKRSASLGSIGGGGGGGGGEKEGTANGGSAAIDSESQRKTRNRSRSLSGGSSKELQKMAAMEDEDKKVATTAKLSTTTPKATTPAKEAGGSKKKQNKTPAVDNKTGTVSTTTTTKATCANTPKHDKTSASTVSPKKKHKKNPSSTTVDQEQQHSKSSTSKKNVQEIKDKQRQQHKHQQQQKAPQKRAPTMDVLVHRIRHFNYQPTAIVCMRASPPPPPFIRVSTSTSTTKSIKDYNLLAISRANGSVELHAMNEKARIIATIAGYHDEQRHVSTMTWLGSGSGNINEPSPTLIGASPDGSIFIIDFCNSRFSGMISSGGGGVFSLASLGQRNDARGSCCGAGLVAAGCQDGSVRILQCKKNHATGRARLEIVSTLPSASAAVLSVAWQPRSKNVDGGADNMDIDGDAANINDMVGSVIYAGIAEGTIRRYDCLGAADGAVDDGSYSSCRWKASLRMTVESHGRQIPTRIWALETLQDGTVISGDSLGHVQFWDGQTGSLLQSLDQTDTKADVLDIAVSADECKVFCSGVDSRVICIERKQKQQKDGMMDVDGNDDDYRPWILSNAQRPHTHDVKAVTICREPVSNPDVAGQERVQPTEILCTGGVDTKLCTYSVANFQRQRPRIIYPWPSFSPVSLASRARLVSLMRDDCVDLYRLGKKSQPVKVREPVMVPEEETLVGTVKVKGPSSLVCSTLSDNGQFLVVSDGAVVYLFSISLGKDDAFSVSRLSGELPTPLSIASAKFIRDDCLLLAATDGRIIVLEFRKSGSGSEMELDDASESANQEVVVIVKQIIETKKDEQSQTSLPAHSMIATSCGRWFATLRNEIGGDGKVEIYSSGGENGLYRREWVVPSLDSPVSAVSFLEGRRPQLAVACVNFALYVFDIKDHRLNTWSEAAGFPLSSSIPADLASRRDFPVRLSADQSSPSKVLMCSFGAFVVMDMKNDFPNCCRIFPETHVRYKKKRPASALEGSGEHKEKEKKKSEAVICLRYNSMLHLDFVGPREMIVVEQPWLNVVANFPEALQRRIYGA